MKTSMSPEETEVTPSKKKLKQARLPFKIISEVSSSPVAPPPSRKRKSLSSPVDESVSKVGKISKENDIEGDPVIISDDESKDGESAEKLEKMPNPYVKLVDTARKKKLQKTKASRKKKGKRKDSVEIVENDCKNTDAQFCSVINTEHVSDKSLNDCEMMEVDEPANDNDIENVTDSKQETENTVNKSLKPDCDIEIIDDSNNSSDTSQNFSEKSETYKDSCKSNKVNTVAKKDKAENIDDLDKSSVTENLNKESPSTPHNKCENKSEEIKTAITPKRSARNKAKQEENNNSKGSPSSSKLNESMTSNPTTPIHGRRASTTKLDDSVNEATPMSNLTPKQLQKRLESAKKREEREKEKQERDRKKLQEKEERAKQKQEKEEQKKREREEKEEAKKREREEKEEQRKKEKEEKEKQKELEKKQKEEKEEQKRKEKEEKEDQKRKEREAREEEKRKKQEALELEKQEQELKKKKTAEAFASFFVPKQKTDKDQIVGTVSNNMLSNFALKSDMRLAPTSRHTLSEQKAQELVKLIEEQSIKEDNLYLKNLRNGTSRPKSCGKTWPLSDKDEDDVIIVEVNFTEDEMPPPDGAGEVITCEPVERENLRPKLLSFHENRRPPYWGTWRKKSIFVKPRKPFGQDEKLLDYEVDSDEDWEEEQEGESIDGSAAGSDDELGPDEYEVDNEVFVPHGYLSDEEATMDEEDNVLSLSPETQKARLKHLEDEFESEMKKPTEKLKPRFYGPLWETSEGGKPENCVDAMWNYFRKFAMILNDPTPLLQPSQETTETEKKKVKKKKTPTEGEQKSPKTEKKKKVKVQDKESKPVAEKKNAQEVKKNQPGINMFLKKLKST